MPSGKYIRGTLVDRIKAIIYERPDGCWWLDSVPHWTGYAMIQVNGKTRQAHIVLYELFFGPVPDDLDLDHLCHLPEKCAGGYTCPHRRCVNPYHLKPATHKENCSIGRSAVSQTGGAAWNREKTECPAGHPYDEKNTWVGKDGTRHCRECDRIAHNIRRAALGVGLSNKSKTYCPQGHEYTEENTYIGVKIGKKGNVPFRVCRACGRERARVKRDRRKQAAVERAKRFFTLIAALVSPAIPVELPLRASAED